MEKTVKYCVFLMLLFCLTAFRCDNAFTGEIKDLESASHADTAAFYDIVDTYEYPEFSVIQFNLAVLSHYSYMLISNQEALIVDPGRDVFRYMEVAKERNAVIKGVLLSHSHADFIAGHAELAQILKCPVYISEKANAGYTHEPLKDGSVITIGDTTLKVLETPGHTLDCTTTLVYTREDLKNSKVLFTGDTLFVGSVGRPDLMGGTMSAAELASKAYDTWNDKLSKINDTAVIYPAHGAGSLCGAHLSDEPYSTIGKERQTNHYLQMKSRSDFIAAILDGLPDAPQYFKHNAAINREGPELVNWEAVPAELEADIKLADSNMFYIADIRDPKEYAEGHIPNSVNIGLRGRLETWTGIMVPWDAKLVLTGNMKELKEALSRLHRVGYKPSVISFEKWKNAGLPLSKLNLVKPEELYSQMQKGESPVIVDVRLPKEWMALRIGMIVNLPINQLDVLSSKLDPKQKVLAVCNSAYRSNMAAGILERKGFKYVSSLDGGSEAWIKAGYPVYGAETKKASVDSQVKREIKLPDRISAVELKNLIMDLPGTFDLVDIRPPEQFLDYSLPGSVNVDIPDLIQNASYLAGTGPLIIVDRDGSLSMILAGMLFQKSQRVIKVLRGGIEAYWNESEVKDLLKGSPKSAYTSSQKTVPPSVQTSTATAMKTEPLKTQVPEKPKKKSAGC